MNRLKALLKKFEAKAGDHPNASSDPDINPTSGVQDDSGGDGKSLKSPCRLCCCFGLSIPPPDPLEKETKERIASGQGSSHWKATVRAGSTTTPGTLTRSLRSAETAILRHYGPFSFLSLVWRARNKIYEIVLRHGPQNIVLNLTGWQLPKIERGEQPNKNVTQYGISITQTCRAMRVETLKLFYFTNTLVLDMADFDDHTSPIMTPPWKATAKLQAWRDIAGSEAIQAARKVDIMLHYHYFGPESRLQLDSNAAAVLKNVLHPETVISFVIAVHMPIPYGMTDTYGYLSGLKVRWTLGEVSTLWRDRIKTEAWTFCERFMNLTGHMHGTAEDDRICAMISVAAAFLASGISSVQTYTDKPAFGPVLPPKMEDEREAVARVKRQEAWHKQQDAN